MQISNRVHALRVPFSLITAGGAAMDRFAYLYLIYGTEICLINTGVASSAELIFDYVRKTDRKVSDIALVIQTDSHPDHIGATRLIKAETGCSVAIHPAERTWLEDVDLQAEERPIQGFHDLVFGSVAVNRALGDNEIVDLGCRMAIAFVAAVYLTIGSGFTVFARYALPLIPAGCLLAALAVESVRRALGRVALVFPALLAVVAAPSLVNSVWIDVLLTRTDTRVLAARWLSERLPPDSTVFESGREYVTLDIASPRLHRWRYDPATRHFAGATADRLPAWLILHRSPLAEYTPVPEPVEALARRSYVPVREFAATTDGVDPAAYDQQDAFFLPLAGFGHWG